MQSLLNRAARRVGYATTRDSMTIIAQGIRGIPSASGARAPYTSLVDAREALWKWWLRTRQPVNTQISQVEQMLATLPLRGVTRDGHSLTVRAASAADASSFIELYMPSDEWSEVELIIEWARTPQRFAEAIEAGAPLPAWIAESHREGYEAGWLVFRRHRSTIPKPSAVSQASTPVAATQIEHAARGSKKQATYASPFSPHTKVLFITPEAPAVSWQRFHRFDTKQLLQTGAAGRTRNFIEAQRARRKGKPVSDEEKQALSTRLESARQTRSKWAIERAEYARKLEKSGATRADIATVLGVDQRTVRRYLASPSENAS